MSRTPVALRPIEDHDIALFFEFHNDPESIKLAAFPPRSEHRFRTHWTKLMINPKVLNRTIMADEKVAGYVAKFERDGLLEVCYWLGREFWSKGVATAALTQFLALVPERPLHARVITHNLPSKRVLEKCGFKTVSEGTLTNDRGQTEHEYLLRLD